MTFVTVTIRHYRNLVLAFFAGGDGDLSSLDITYVLLGSFSAKTIDRSAAFRIRTGHFTALTSHLFCFFHLEILRE